MNPALVLLAFGAASASAEPPATMTAIQAVQPASGSPPGGWDEALELSTSVKTPRAGPGEVLIRVRASSVNPVDWKILEPSGGVPKFRYPFIPGFDVSGEIAELGLGCSDRLKIGDAVWADIGAESLFLRGGTYAEYVLAQEKAVGLKPASLSFTDAATLPLVGLTSLESLRKAGGPWDPADNKTVVITSGPGGTGFVGIQLAKAMGAGCVITAAAPSSIDFCKALGADVVVDYHTTDVIDMLADDSVDVVYDNYGANGTADRAMPKIKSGGAFVFLPGKGGSLSKHPKPGVSQYSVWTSSGDYKNLDALAGYNVSAAVDTAFPLARTAEAFTRSVAGNVTGKLAIVVGNATRRELNDVVGYYSWNWGKGSRGPGGANIGVAFTGLTDVSKAIAGYTENASWCCPPLSGNKYLSIGGGNAAGQIGVADLRAIASKSNVSAIAAAGYAGVVFDVEEVIGAAAETGPAFAAAFAACKQQGLGVVVTTSHSAPYQTDSSADAVALVRGWAQDENIDVLSPQLYSSGQETSPQLDITSSCAPDCSWDLYRGAKAKFAPSIVDESHLPAVREFFEGNTTLGIKVDGFFQWKQT